MSYNSFQNKDTLVYDDGSSLGFQPWFNNYLNRFSFVQHVPSAPNKEQPIPQDMKPLPYLQHLNQIASQVWQPEFDLMKNCSILILNNIIHPRIIMVDCDANISHRRVVCRKNVRQNLQRFFFNKVCPMHTFAWSHLCYSTHFKSVNAFPKCVKSSVCNIGKSVNASQPLVTLLEIMTTMKGTNETYISLSTIQGSICNVMINIHSPSYMAQKLTWLQKYQPCFETSGLFLCSTNNTIQSKQLSNVFECDDKTYISTIMLCDGISHCSNSADENLCSNPIRNPSTQSCQIKEMKQTVSESQCLLWMDRQGILKSYSFNTFGYPVMPSDNKSPGIRNKNWIKESTAEESYTCNDGQLIPTDLINDTIPDCTQGEDEWAIDADSSQQQCPDPTMLPCIPGHSKCFKRNEICLKRRHPLSGYLQTCRNGAHLAECSTFTCNGNFKCPGYYCVHLSHICDGIYDCPNGDDEADCSSFVCTNKFKCAETSIHNYCVHMEETCDGIYHCPQKDDELACDIKTCWPNCHCLNYAMYCDGFDATYIGFGSVLPYVYVSVSNTSLQAMFLEHFQDTFQKSYFLHMIMNNISSICPNLFKGMSNIILLNLKNNSVERLTEGCFSSLKNLKHLNLKNNKIRVIAANSFKELHNLTCLDFSQNRLDKLQVNTFSGLYKLASLDISNNEIVYFCMSSFSKHLPSLKNVETDDYRICCLEERSSVVCRVEPPWPSSCENSLGNTGIQRLLIIIVALTFPLNILSVFRHVKRIRRKKSASPALLHNKRVAYFAIVMCINGSDALYSTYLLSIIAIDMSYQGHFSSIEVWWKSSGICYAISCIYIFSSLSSIFCITFLALTRNRLTVCPLKTVFARLKANIKALLSGVCVLILISVILVLCYRFADHNVCLSNSLCLLIGNTGSSVTEKFTSIFFIVVKFLAVLFNIGLYTHLLHSLATQKQALSDLCQKEGTPSPTNNRSVKVTTVVQLLALSVSNFLCWVPEASLNIISLCVSNYPITALVWIIVVATPLNGVINPIVFNISLVGTLFSWIKSFISSET